MKLIGVVLPLLLLLTGCGSSEPLAQAMELRADLLTAQGCSFEARITADYGDSLERFTLDCHGSPTGDVTFSVTEPETIAGITGTLSPQGGRITFDEHALAFGYLTDDQLSPVSAPWIFLSTLRGGYLTSACREGDLIHVSGRDSYQENALLADLWLDANRCPIRCELLYRGRRILTLEIGDFHLQKV